MSEKNKFRPNNKEITKGLIFSLILLFPIIIYGYIENSPAETIWPAVVISTAGCAFIWLMVRMGVFSTSSHGARRVGNSLRDRKRNKLGAYNPDEKKKSKSVKELMNNNKNKSKQGIYVMFIVALIEFISTIYTYI